MSAAPILSILLLLAAVSCGGAHGPSPSDPEVPKMKIEAVLDKHESELMASPGVEGVGIGGTRKAPVILVMVRGDGTAAAARLPKTLGGYPVKVEVTGPITAY